MASWAGLRFLAPRVFLGACWGTGCGVSLTRGTSRLTVPDSVGETTPLGGDSGVVRDLEGVVDGGLS